MCKKGYAMSTSNMIPFDILYDKIKVLVVGKAISILELAAPLNGAGDGVRAGPAHEGLRDLKLVEIQPRTMDLILGGNQDHVEHA